MTNKQKLLKLLEIAVDNGWKDKKDLLNQFESIVDNISLYVDDVDFVGTLHSLNDLVTNWEEDEVSFIEALCEASNLEDVFSTHPNFYRTIWIEIPTSQRLDWLFETFNHLLQN
jgi:hypothetical protein